MQLTDFVEIPLNDRVRKLELGQIILIDQVDTNNMLINMYPREVGDYMKPRDPKLSRTLYPPFGAPMFVQDTELEKWLRHETEVQTGRNNAKAFEASTQRTNGSHHRG